MTTQPDGPVLGSRALVRREDGRAVTITVGLPHPADVDWYCPFWIRGLKAEIAAGAYGIDGIQATQNALQAVRFALDRAGGTFDLDAGDAPPPPGTGGYTGFPYAIPDWLGPDFEATVRRFADDEATRTVRSRRAAPPADDAGGAG